MTDPVLALVVLGAEAHPPEAWVTQIATPAAILAFFGTTYLLVRSNLGTKRGYLLVATMFFGFIMLISMFWAFGAPGTPPASGPRTLPGQQLGELDPRWIPFAEDSRLAQEERMQPVADFPEGFETYESLDEAEAALDEEAFDEVEDGVDDIRNFFADYDLLETLDEPIEIGVAETGEGELLLGVTYHPIDEETFEPDPDEEPYTAFAYFEEGAQMLPSFVMFGLALVGFVLHGWLLDRDERLERREAEELQQAEEPERVPAGGGT